MLRVIARQGGMCRHVISKKRVHKTNERTETEKHCKKRDLSHTLPLAPLGGELRFEMTNTIQTHQFIAKILYRTQVKIKTAVDNVCCQSIIIGRCALLFAVSSECKNSFGQCYINMYLDMNSMAKIYMAGVIFLYEPHIRFKST